MQNEECRMQNDVSTDAGASVFVNFVLFCGDESFVVVFPGAPRHPRAASSRRTPKLCDLLRLFAAMNQRPSASIRGLRLGLG
jgi:hypothetical protein